MKKFLGITLGAILLILIGGYIAFAPSEPILPPAEPLTVSEEEIAKLYGVNMGEYRIEQIDALTIKANDRALEVSVFYPDGVESAPLILFSHGNFSDRTEYDRLIHHWVSHGYAVIAPDHLDSGGMVNGIWAMVTHGQDGVMRERPKDMSFILDNLDQVKAVLPDTMVLDLKNLVAAGHSFGAFVAQMMGGAEAINPEDGSAIVGYDARVQYVLAISPPGPMFDMITEESWRNLKIQQLVTTGTWDVDGEFFKTWDVHAMSYETAPVGSSLLMVTEGADHYLGNLICRTDRDAEPQYDALKMMLSSTTAFLDAVVKDETEALIALMGNQLGTVTNGWSTISSR